MAKLNPRRVPIPMLKPEERRTHFAEIQPGYTEEQALAEAQRCLLCPKPKCVEGCPARNDIPGLMKAVQQRRFDEAIRILRRRSNLPAFCSRVCDQARQCEGACVIIKKGEPVAIGAIERFVADLDLRDESVQQRPPQRPGRVAVVGSGPAGITIAGDMAQLGHEATVLEARPVAGGVLAWGIPSFRLPVSVLKTELGRLTQLGVRFQVRVRVGQDVSIDSLLKDYDAVFVGIGTDKPRALGVPGEDLERVYQATDFLAWVKLAQLGVEGYPLPKVGERVAVIGAGNTAFDAAQTALRLGATDVTIVYRRSAEEAPARSDELEHARQEGIAFQWLTAPVRFTGEGRVRQMTCIRMKLGEPEADGRRKPVPDPGSEFTVDVDTVVLALGFSADPTALTGVTGLETKRDGLLTVDPETLRTSRQGVWAAGDVVTGPSTVVSAMAQAKKAAKDIHNYLERRYTVG